MLVDQHNRIHNYLRISLTEKCNLRCEYCMPAEGIPLRDKASFMTNEEIIAISKEFVELGVTKIRITGGEPLVKKGIDQLLTQLAELKVELAITTNAILLDKHLELLKKLGILKLNISLDSLNEDVFNKLSRRSYFKQILENINAAIKMDFTVQINMVVIKGINEQEVVSFVEWTRNEAISIRFIEFMPFDSNEWNWDRVMPQKQLLEVIYSQFQEENVVKQVDGKNSTSKNYAIKGFKGSFGFISTITQPFCDTCNRIRLTADGKIKNCLFSNEETDLLAAYRNQQSVKDLIEKSIASKHAKHAGIDFSDSQTIHKNRTMIAIGG